MGGFEEGGGWDAPTPPNFGNANLVAGSLTLVGASGPYIPNPVAPAGSGTFSSGNPHWDVTSPRFGAKGDGVTDDTAAIQAAMDAAAVVGGGRVWLPATITIPTIYKITAPLQFKTTGYSSIQLVGQGRNTVTIQQATANTPIVQFIAELINRWVIQDLTLAYAANQSSVNTNAQAINFNVTGGVSFGWFWGQLLRLEIIGANVGIGIQGTGQLPVWNCLFDDIVMKAISLRMIDMVSPTATGMPTSIWRRITHINSSTPTGAAAAIRIAGAEIVAESIGIEDWGDTRLFDISGGTPVSFRGVHIERWTGANAGTAVNVANGSAIFEDVSVTGTPNANNGITFFSAQDSLAQISVNRFLASGLTIANSGGFTFISAVVGSKIFLQGLLRSGGTAFNFLPSNSISLNSIIQDGGLFASIGALGNAPSVGSGGAGTSALSILANSTNLTGQFQVTTTGVIAGAVLGVVTFAGNPLSAAPRTVMVSLAGPVAGVATPVVVGADTYTTNGFTLRALNAPTNATYIVNFWVCQ